MSGLSEDEEDSLDEEDSEEEDSEDEESGEGTEAESDSESSADEEIPNEKELITEGVQKLDVSSSSDEGGERERCPVCLNRFIGQDLGIPENCEHVFCLECIKEWSKNVNTCPIDRNEFNFVHLKSTPDGKVLKKIRVRVHSKGPDDSAVVEESTLCEVCRLGDREDRLLLCDACDLAYHCDCLDPPLFHIPIEEWFCPPCSGVMTQLESSGAMPSASRSRRVIPRTRASETVRVRVQNRRTYPSASSPRTTSVKRPKKRKRRTYRRCIRKVVKLARTKGAMGSGKGGKAERATAVMVTYRKRYKRRRRRKTKKSTRLPSRTTEASIQSAKERIAKRLGLVKARTGVAMPEVKSKAGGSSKGSSSDRSHSLFGNRDQLMDFNENFNEDQAGPSTSSTTRNPHQKSEASADPFSFLDSILEGQKILHTKSDKVVIRNDGSLILKEEDKKKAAPKASSASKSVVRLGLYKPDVATKGATTEKSKGSSSSLLHGALTKKSSDSHSKPQQKPGAKSSDLQFNRSKINQKTDTCKSKCVSSESGSSSMLPQTIGMSSDLSSTKQKIQRANSYSPKIDSECSGNSFKKDKRDIPERNKSNKDTLTKKISDLHSKRISRTSTDSEDFSKNSCKMNKRKDINIKSEDVLSNLSRSQTSKKSSESHFKHAQNSKSNSINSSDLDVSSEISYGASSSKTGDVIPNHRMDILQKRAAFLQKFETSLASDKSKESINDSDALDQRVSVSENSHYTSTGHIKSEMGNGTLKDYRACKESVSTITPPILEKGTSSQINEIKVKEEPLSSDEEPESESLIGSAGQKLFYSNTVDSDFEASESLIAQSRRTQLTSKAQNSWAVMDSSVEEDSKPFIKKEPVSSDESSSHLPDSNELTIPKTTIKTELETLSEDMFCNDFDETQDLQTPDLASTQRAVSFKSLLKSQTPTSIEGLPYTQVITSNNNLPCIQSVRSLEDLQCTQAVESFDDLPCTQAEEPFEFENLPCTQAVESFKDLPCAQEEESFEKLPCTQAVEPFEDLPCTQAVQSFENLPCTQAVETFEDFPCTQAVEGFENLPCTQAIQSFEDLPCTQAVQFVEDLPCTQAVQSFDDLPCTQAVQSFEDLPCTQAVQPFEELPCTQAVQPFEDLPCTQAVQPFEDLPCTQAVQPFEDLPCTQAVQPFEDLPCTQAVQPFEDMSCTQAVESFEDTLNTNRSSSPPELPSTQTGLKNAETLFDSDLPATQAFHLNNPPSCSNVPEAHFSKSKKVGIKAAIPNTDKQLHKPPLDGEELLDAKKLAALLRSESKDKVAKTPKVVGVHKNLPQVLTSIPVRRPLVPKPINKRTFSFEQVKQHFNLEEQPKNDAFDIRTDSKQPPTESKNTSMLKPESRSFTSAQPHVPSISHFNSLPKLKSNKLSNATSTNKLNSSLDAKTQASLNKESFQHSSGKAMCKSNEKFSSTCHSAEKACSPNNIPQNFLQSEILSPSCIKKEPLDPIGATCNQNSSVVSNVVKHAGESNLARALRIKREMNAEVLQKSVPFNERLQMQSFNHDSSMLRTLSIKQEKDLEVMRQNAVQVSPKETGSVQIKVEKEEESDRDIPCESDGREICKEMVIEHAEAQHVKKEPKEKHSEKESRSHSSTLEKSRGHKSKDGSNHKSIKEEQSQYDCKESNSSLSKKHGEKTTDTNDQYVGAKTSDRKNKNENNDRNLEDKKTKRVEKDPSKNTKISSSREDAEKDTCNSKKNDYHKHSNRDSCENRGGKEKAHSKTESSGKDKHRDNKDDNKKSKAKLDISCEFEDEGKMGKEDRSAMKRKKSFDNDSSNSTSGKYKDTRESKRRKTSEDVKKLHNTDKNNKHDYKRSDLEDKQVERYESSSKRAYLDERNTEKGTDTSKKKDSNKHSDKDSYRNYDRKESGHSKTESSGKDSHSKTETSGKDKHFKTETSGKDKRFKTESSGKDKYSKTETSGNDKHSKTENSEKDKHSKTESSRKDKYSKTKSSGKDKYSKAESSGKDKYSKAESSGKDKYSKAESSGKDTHLKTESLEKDKHSKTESSRRDKYSKAESSGKDKYSKAESSGKDKHLKTESSRKDKYSDTESSVKDKHSKTESSEKDKHKDRREDVKKTKEKSRNYEDSFASAMFADETMIKNESQPVEKRKRSLEDRISELTSDKPKDSGDNKRQKMSEGVTKQNCKSSSRSHISPDSTSGPERTGMLGLCSDIKQENGLLDQGSQKTKHRDSCDTREGKKRNRETVFNEDTSSSDISQMSNHGILGTEVGSIRIKEEQKPLVTDHKVLVKVERSSQDLKEDIASEIKDILKPFFTVGVINKDDYKDIMRRAVPKVFLNCGNCINPEKIKKLVLGYISKLKNS